MTDYEIRLLGPGDDLEAQRDLSERAFGALTTAGRDTWLRRTTPIVADGRFLGVFDAGRPAGGALFHDMPQWWGGRRVPMAGVGGVRMAPEDRGKGAGRALVAALLEEIAGRGYPLSTLYPATMPVYRSLGWELAGARYQVKIPAYGLRNLAKPSRDVPLRRPGPGDEQAVLDVIDAVHERSGDHGPIRGEDKVRGWLADPDEYCYLADDGVLAYRWGSADDLTVHAAIAASMETTRALWGVVASNAWMIETVTAVAGPADPIWWLTAERDADIARRAGWMLRVVDAPAAIAARGFPPAVSLSMPLAITDPGRPGNAGTWTLTVGDGKGALIPNGAGVAGPAPLALGARGLAALYGGAPVGSLRRAGLAESGTPAADAALDAAFAAAPYMLDAF